MGRRGIRAEPGRRGGQGMDKRILIAEDDEDIRMYMQQLLTPEGYHVSVVDNGLDLLRLAGSPSSHFDLIIADVNMPKGRGDSTIGILRKQKIDIPALLVTGVGNSNPPEGVPVLSKPFTRRQLLEKIREILGDDADAANPSPKVK